MKVSLFYSCGEHSMYPCLSIHRQSLQSELSFQQILSIRLGVHYCIFVTGTKFIGEEFCALKIS